MQIIPRLDCIRCHFEKGIRDDKTDQTGNVEVIFAKTNDLRSVFPYLKTLISGDEILRAGRFRFNEDRETYIACHALLRSVISKKLNIIPTDILFIPDSRNKPGLSVNTLSFNITHTREAFAFAVSDYSYIGIDLEKIRQDFDYISIAKDFFSEDEQKYIIESEQEACYRFFLLWTRKEALLKAFGTGIVVDLTQIEVFRQDNFIDGHIFSDVPEYSKSNNTFIYSTEVLNSCLSIAVPSKADVILNRITENNFDSLLN